MNSPAEASNSNLPAVLAMLMGAVVLAFVAGAFVIHNRVYPYQHLNTAFTAAAALKSKITDYKSVLDTSLWHKSRDLETGVVFHDPSRTQPGLTLFTSSHSPTAFLVDLNGKIVHRWLVPSESVTGAEGPDGFAYLRKAHVFPNGDLLTFFEKVDTTPWGIALVRVDMDGKLVWSYDRPIHHDFDIGPNGRIYALDSAVVTTRIPKVPAQYFPLLDDEIVVLDNGGKELQRVSITKALANSPYRRLMNLLKKQNKGDLLHTNSISLVTNKLAAAFPFLDEGQVVVSILQGNMIAAVDLDSASVTWALHGYWLRQHDVDLLPSGHFLLFDNRGHFGRGGVSRVIEVNPMNMEIAWQYAGSADQPLHSQIRSAQSRLANGNTLITESDEGRLVEVTNNGEIVWDYRSPWRYRQDPSYTSVLSWAERVDPTDFEGAFAERIAQALGGEDPHP